MGLFAKLGDLIASMFKLVWKIISYIFKTAVRFFNALAHISEVNRKNNARESSIDKRFKYNKQEIL